MPIENFDESIYNHYDKLVALAIFQIEASANKSNLICLNNFDRKNKEHWFMLRMALIARDLYQYSVVINASWWNVFLVNWKMRKSFFKVGRAKTPLLEGVWTEDVLNELHAAGAESLGEDFSLADIYEAYYEGSK